MTQWLRILTVLICVACSTAVGYAALSQIDDGSHLTPVADVTVTGSATLVSAASNNRAALNCTNTSASVNVRWGSSSVTAATGQQLRAGLAISIRNTGAVYMISEGANVTVSCTEEIR